MLVPERGPRDGEGPTCLNLVFHALQRKTFRRLVCVYGVTLKGYDEMLVVCVTDTQPKECNGKAEEIFGIQRQLLCID
ncbi:hypothetical protein EYF80_006052 [Liparis tanakae]|uniref:Uncharacterized protein n=1 Tax=Liparis tanakae TaxID=230148 RepID=A0A4Z2J138_9TELE|nr:hypothetical protein EYF80_006052 [Liparis tanakae]